MTFNLHTANNNYRQDFKVVLLIFKCVFFFLLELHEVCTMDAKCKWLGNSVKFRHAYKKCLSKLFHT